jgi:hypothetical protein
MTNDDMPSGVKLPKSVHDRAKEHMADGHPAPAAYAKALKEHLKDKIDDDEDDDDDKRPRGGSGGY